MPRIHRRRSFGTIAGLTLVLFAALALIATASPAADNGKLFWVNLAGTAEQRPDFVYFTANSGGHVDNVKWKNWGDGKAIGRGFFRDTSPSYPGKLNQNGPAKLVARQPVRCTPEFGDRAGKTIRVYRYVKLIYPNGRGGQTRADVSHTAGWLTCKEFQ